MPGREERLKYHNEKTIELPDEVGEDVGHSIKEVENERKNIFWKELNEEGNELVTDDLERYNRKIEGLKDEVKKLKKIRKQQKKINKLEEERMDVLNEIEKKKKREKKIKKHRNH